MSTTTAVSVGDEGRLGLMVRTPTELFVYWLPTGTVSPSLALRIVDLTGRPPEELLDRCGHRMLPVADSLYVGGLLPGHLYAAEVGHAGPDGFKPVLSAGPVQTPWLAGPGDAGVFPSPYHRS